MKRADAARSRPYSAPPPPRFVQDFEGRLVSDLARFLSAVHEGECALTRQGEPSRSDTRRIVTRIHEDARATFYSEFLVFLAIQLDLVERVEGRLCLHLLSSRTLQDPCPLLASAFEAWCRSPFWSERYPRRRIAWCGDQLAFAFYREPMPRYREVALGALRGLPVETWVPFDRLLEVARALGFDSEVRWGFREAFGGWEEESEGPHVILARFVQEALLWLGVVRVGREARGTPRFSLYVTGDGARLMGHPRGPQSLGAAVAG